MGRDQLRLIVRAALIAALVMGCISDKVREASPSPRPTATSSVMRMPTASPGGKATIGPHPTQTPNAIVITAELPAGGISETRAIEMAREHVRLDARLWATMAGRLIEVNGSLGHDGNIWADPLKDRWVWGIQFDLPVEICPPPPHDCLEPRPGLSTVILDYYTGSHNHSSVYSPGSGRLDLPYGAVLDPLTLAISNRTDLNVTLVLNDQTIGVFPPGVQEDPINPALLPAPPWHVEALTAGGRALLSLDVSPGDVWHSDAWQTHGSMTHGAAARADLSCGRLDVWSGPPLAGPISVETFPPGDCDP